MSKGARAEQQPETINGGQNVRLTCWRVAALTEPAFRRGGHCYLPLAVKNFFAADETVLLEVLTKPESEGGKGFYKVLFYCDENDRMERQAFAQRKTDLVRAFTPNIIGPDIEL